MPEFLPELADLGRYHGPAISLVGILEEIFLVVILRGEERGRREQFRDQGSRPDCLRGQFVHNPPGRIPLRISAVEDDGSVLGADVGALPVQGRGIMDREEHRQDVLQRRNVRVEGHLDRKSVV